MLLNKQLIIFDMDGIIFDTERLGIECWERAFNYYSIPIPKNLLYEKIGLNSKDSKKLFFKELGNDFDYDLVKNKKRFYIKKHIQEKGTPIKEGLLFLLDYLDKHNIKKVIATSRSQEMTNYYLENSLIKDRFEHIITGDMIEKGKPNPDIFLNASTLMNVDKKQCLVLEDSINGIKAAANANIEVVMIPDLVQPSIKELEIVIDSLSTLKDVIALLEKKA